MGWELRLTGLGIAGGESRQEVATEDATVALGARTKGGAQCLNGPLEGPPLGRLVRSVAPADRPPSHSIASLTALLHPAAAI